jgi:hypothetical protein
MRLIISGGPDAGRELELSGRLVVGREEGCDLVLDDEKASRRHCALTLNPDGTATLEDLGSSNGTFLDGRRITEPVTLRGGEELRIGSTTMRVRGERATARATVIGAPATVASATPPQPPIEPPPPAPPGPPDRPSWRSRWALIAAAALIVIGGTVGGVLAATAGGSDEEDATTATATGAQEPAVVTVTVPATTAAPPATDVQPETGAADAGITPEQEQLLAHVPPGIQATCVSYPPDAPKLLAGLVAGLSCEQSNGITPQYLQYDSQESMETAYFAYAVSTDARDRGDCSKAFPAEGTYSIDGQPAGRVNCFNADEIFTNGGPPGPVIWWTTDSLAILASASWPNGPDTQLFDWWTTEPGPLP